MIYVLGLQWSLNVALPWKLPITIGRKKDREETNLVNTAVAVSSLRRFLLPSLAKFLTRNDMHYQAAIFRNYSSINLAVFYKQLDTNGIKCLNSTLCLPP